MEAEPGRDVAAMRRVAIVGSSGVGKSTLADALARRFDLETIELDALMHGPNWEPTPTPEFRVKVASAIARADDARHGWVVPGNYRTVTDIVHRNADTVVWLDLPRRVSMWRLLKRSVRRAATREQVWGGNTEQFRNLVSRDPQRNVLLWSWQNHPKYQAIYSEYEHGDFWDHVDLHHLRSTDEVDAFVRWFSR